MSYEKQTWATGDTITAQKLNHMEDGIAGAGVECDLYIDMTTMSGIGLSFDELWTMVTVNHVMPVILVNRPHYSGTYNYLWFLYDLIAYTQNNVRTLASDNDNNILMSDDGYFGSYTYTYDSATKTYTIGSSGGGGES